MKPATTEDATPVLGGDGWVALPFRMADPLRQYSHQGVAGASRLATARRGPESRVRIGLHAMPTTECIGPFYRVRYYDPIRSRFIAQDPIRFAGGDPNLYGYVFEDPTYSTDPSGQFVPQVIGGIVGGVVGAYLAAQDPHADTFSIAKGIFLGAGFGILSTVPIPGVNPLLAGAAWGLASDLGVQLVVQGKSIRCLDPFSAAVSTLTSGLGTAYGQAVRRLAYPNPLTTRFERQFAGSLEAYLSGIFAGYFGPTAQLQLQQIVY